MEQVNNNLTKIILFCDDNKLRRLQAGYYGESKDWNPNGEITLKRIKDIEDMANQGVKFEQTPSIKEENTVFVEVEPKHYACIQEYAPSLIKNKQKALASVLQKLGIHEYFIKSEFNLDSGSDVIIGTRVRDKQPQNNDSCSSSSTCTGRASGLLS